MIFRNRYRLFYGLLIVSLLLSVFPKAVSAQGASDPPQAPPVLPDLLKMPVSEAEGEVDAAHSTAINSLGFFDWQGNWYNRFNFGNNWNYYYYLRYYQRLYATRPQYLARDINSLGLGWMCLAPGLCESLGIRASDLSPDGVRQEEPDVLSLPVFNGIGGANGAWNQFDGKQPFPDVLGMDVNNPLGGDMSATALQAPLHIQAILGYDPFSGDNFGTEFSANLDSLQAPWNFHAPWLTEDGFGQNEPAYVADVRAVGQSQLDTVYTANALGDLRTEQVNVPFHVLYRDPYYTYWDTSLNQYMTSIYTSRSAYPTLVNALNTINSWQDVATDQNTLLARYTVRLLAKYLQAMVEYQVRLYLNQNPEAQQWVNSVNNTLSNRRDQLYQAANISGWSDNWQSQWSTQYDAAVANSGVTQETQQLLAAHPGLEEYWQLNSQVVELLSQFDTHPAAQQVAAERGAVFDDTTVISAVNSAYDQYTDVLETQLNSVAFLAEIERYTESVSALAGGDSTYQGLLQESTRITNNVNAYKQYVYDYINACLPVEGDACYTKQDLLDYTTGPEVQAMLAEVGELYEAYRVFWYAFYRGASYQQMEANAIARITQALAPVRETINAARTDFIVQVNDISQVKQLRINSVNALLTLRGQENPVFAASIGEKWSALSAELDQKLTRMTELGMQLHSVGGGATLAERLYLPLTGQ